MGQYRSRYWFFSEKIRYKIHVHYMKREFIPRTLKFQHNFGYVCTHLQRESSISICLHKEKKKTKSMQNKKDRIKLFNWFSILIAWQLKISKFILERVNLNFALSNFGSKPVFRTRTNLFIKRVYLLTQKKLPTLRKWESSNSLPCIVSPNTQFVRNLCPIRSWNIMET